MNKGDDAKGKKESLDVESCSNPSDNEKELLLLLEGGLGSGMGKTKRTTVGVLSSYEGHEMKRERVRSIQRV